MRQQFKIEDGEYIQKNGAQQDVTQREEVMMVFNRETSKCCQHSKSYLLPRIREKVGYEALNRFATELFEADKNG